MIVRRCTPADADRLARIRDEAFRARKGDGSEPVERRGSPDGVAGWIAREEPEVFVAESEGTVVGWGLIYTTENPLAAVFVDPTAPEEAVRERLLDRLERVAEAAGVPSLHVYTY